MPHQLPHPPALRTARRRRRRRTLATVIAAVIAVLLSAATTLGGGSAALAEPLPSGPPATTTADAVRAAAAPTAAGGSRTVTYDGYSMMIDGRRTYIWSGEFHYFRLPSPDLWRDVLEKQRAAGFNTVSLYFDWAYHSPAPGVYDFTGVRDVDRLLDLATELGLYVIARPGPYINAEVDSGGFPAWVDSLPGHARGTNPAYLAAADEWLAKIDPIIARHQLTDGRGTVIAYQVENEFYQNDAAGRDYIAHLAKGARDRGITVPLTGNHNAHFTEGTGALDIDGVDSYPQGFNCSSPDTWKGVPDISYGHAPGRPLFTAEFQAGAFDPWGGPGYDKCRQLLGPQFANVFYQQNIAVGATMQNLYMAYGGTNWGWQADPGTVYTSYDYGAPITEARGLTDTYRQDKLLGYFLQSAAPLTKTDRVAAGRPSAAGVTETVRINPDDSTQFHVLRQTDATSTKKVDTRISLDLGAQAYTVDDQGPEPVYGTGWTRAGYQQGYTADEFRQTESWTDRAGADVTVRFRGTAVRWIASTASNHGLADVYLDGSKVATVDGYSAGTVSQQVLWATGGLAAGEHTLRIVATGRKNASAKGAFVSVDAVDVPGPAGRVYPTVPQEPGTAISLNGRQSKTLVADYPVGASRLRYSTSEPVTHARIGGQDVALLHGDHGQPGETVVEAPTRPTVQVLAGTVRSSWDAATGDLRLNYTHDGLARVLVTGGAQPLLLLLGDTATAGDFWRAETSAGPVLVRGSSLLRSASLNAGTLALTGDNAQAGPVEVFGPAADAVTWNGAALALRPGTGGSRVGDLAAPAAVALPALTGWKKQAENPESRPGFDDSGWRTADKQSSNSTTAPVTKPVLFADEYGFHHGDVWYRGHFTGTAGTTGVSLSALTGKAGVYSVWLNGNFLGSAPEGTKAFAFPAGSVTAGRDNVLAVLLENSGHNKDWSVNDAHKQARGLTGAELTGEGVPALVWRLQGALGGDRPADPARGPMNSGGLFGERSGWSLPGFPDGGWSPAALPDRNSTPGVTWYRTTVDLHLPKGQDTSLGLRITDDRSRHYRALIFVNGWQFGRYINELGPQTRFPIPNGILDTDGTNTIAVAVWNTDTAGGGPGKFELESYGTWRSPTTAARVAAPGYGGSPAAAVAPQVS
ncbi:beta-galactosidase [Kitasatospora purpeofusca]|uniref:beta-galactosidase n=1 Tax=Kitasatospora purpeofusca TaxID=67352 RepID=UPI0035DE5FB0